MATMQFSSVKRIPMQTHPLCSNVLMLKPKVGEIVSISSPLNFFKIVVFPALSNPLNSVKKMLKRLSNLLRIKSYIMELIL